MQDLYYFIRRIRPSIVVETVTHTGDTSEAILRALDKNAHGTLLTLTDTRDVEELFKKSGAWDVFLHDSEHDVGCMTFELELAWRLVKPCGYILADDYTWGTPEHYAWPDFLKRHGLEAEEPLGPIACAQKPMHGPKPPKTVDELAGIIDKCVELSAAAKILYDGSQT